MTKVKLIYSDAYDANVRAWKAGKHLRLDKETISEGQSKAEALQKKWDKIADRVLSTMSEVSGLEWKEELIKGYLVDTDSGFADPLTLSTHALVGLEIEDLMHELGHLLILQNRDKIDFDKLKKTFKNDEGSAVTHALLHSILKLTYQKVFDPDTVSKYIARYQNLPKPYIRAWEIVDSYGAENMIRDFIK